MKSKQFIIIGITLMASIISFSSCSKRPASSFILMEYYYSAGDMLEFDNLSINSDSTRWDLFYPSGTLDSSYGGDNPQIIIGLLNPDGEYVLKLSSHNRRGKRESTDEKKIFVKTIRKTIGIDSHLSKNYDYSVYIDGFLMGTAEDDYFEGEIPIGIRHIRLVKGDREYSETINVDQDKTVYVNF